jgi:GTP-binding protein EngB required for normal cell division
MPDLEPETTMRRFSGELNGPQQRRLNITCEYVDKLLSSIEHILHSAASKSPFPHYIVDITPAQARAIEDHIRRLRSQLLRALAWQHLKPDPPDIPATRAVMTNLTFIDIAIEELKPSYLRGSGGVPEDAVDELNGVVHELSSLVQGMERYVRQELGTNLESRLRKLEGTGYDVALLQLLEQIVTRQGLVEFRSRIDSVASRLEDNNLEVALFGRVSSGKSSLLNALLDTNALPVGINPITAVPTKLRYGASLRASVAYGDGRNEIVTVEELSSLVTEQGNPGNLRNVVRAVVEVPSPRLKQGIVLVDTPGLGSLARRGATETLAYLPSCDLALLLIDAGTTLNEEDIGTLRLLYEAGIPSIVLLSKADMLAEGDLHRVVTYIQEQLHRELGVGVNVHPVSSLQDHFILLDQFFERELLPRFEQARSLRNGSSARKIGALRESVTVALETTLDRMKRRRQDLPTDTHDLEERLRLVTGEVGEQRTILDHAFLKLGETPGDILSQVTDRALRWMRTKSEAHVTSLQLSEWLHDSVQESVDGYVESVRGVGRRTIDTLQRVAREMGRTDMPTYDELEHLLRGMPRFELAALPDNINMTHWMFLGDRVVRSRIANRLQLSIGALLKEELHLYGRALSQWSQQFTKKMQLLIAPYADTYRTQLHRITGVSKDGTDAPQIEHDLALLNERDRDQSRDAMRKRG